MICIIQHINGVMYGFRFKTKLRVKTDLYREFSLWGKYVEESPATDILKFFILK